MSNNTHKSEIQYAVIGTKKQIGLYNELIEKFSKPIESNSRFKLKATSLAITSEGSIDFEDDYDETEGDVEIINKKLNPDFPGFNENSCFKCKFLHNPDYNYIIKSEEIDSIIGLEEKSSEKLFKVVVYIKMHT